LHDGWPHSSSFLAESQSRRSSSDPGQRGARGTILAFAFVGGGGQAGKQASRQGKARQGKATCTALLDALRNSLTFYPVINPAPNNESRPNLRFLERPPPLAARCAPGRCTCTCSGTHTGIRNKRKTKGPCAALTQTGTGHGTAQHTSLHRGKGRPIAFDRRHGGLLEASQSHKYWR